MGIFFTAGATACAWGGDMKPSVAPVGGGGGGWGRGRGAGLGQGVAECSVEERVTGLFRARLVLAADVLVTVGVLVRVAVGPTGVLVRVAVKVAVFVGPLVP